MKKFWPLFLLAATLFAALVSGCGPEAATPDKLYGIWMGKDEGKQVTYTFILGGKCDIDYPKSGKAIESATWEIKDGATIVKRKDGSTESLSLKGYDLTSGSLSLHKLGMEY